MTLRDPDPRFKHEHSWMVATNLVLTEQSALGSVKQLPTLVLVCACGVVWHKVVPPMSEEPPK